MKTASPVSIRRARVADVDAIHAIELASFADPWSRVSFRDSILGDRGLIVVAVDGAQSVVGFAMLIAAADEAELANLAVAKTERRRGVGAALLEHVIGAAVSGGAATLHLEVRASNAAAQALYATRGFTEVSRRRGYYQRPVEDAVVMRLRLKVES